MIDAFHWTIGVVIFGTISDKMGRLMKRMDRLIHSGFGVL